MVMFGKEKSWINPLNDGVKLKIHFYNIEDILKTIKILCLLNPLVIHIKIYKPGHHDPLSQDFPMVRNNLSIFYGEFTQNNSTIRVKYHPPNDDDDDYDDFLLPFSGNFSSHPFGSHSPPLPLRQQQQ